MLDPLALAPLGFIAMFGLLLVRIPIGVAMLIVGLLGFALVVDGYAALNLLRFVPVRTLTDSSLSLIPLFVLMGAIATQSNVSTELFAAAHRWFGHRRGGVAISTIAASAGFGAICGSSVAGAATMTRIALPELRRYGYKDSASAGAIAAGSTLGILIPPSVMLAVYGILTEEDVNRLFIGALIPGLFAALSQVAVVHVLAARHPRDMPASPKSSRRERISALRNIWPAGTTFLLVLGGMYLGLFTATEAAAIGAAGILLIGLLRRKLNVSKLNDAFVDATKTSANIFIILIGAIVFGYFLAITQAPQQLVEAVAAAQWSGRFTLALILLAYIVLGCFLDSLALVALTVPIVHPVIVELGFDPTWFGILLAVTVGIGLTSQPMGLNVFIITSVDRKIRLTDVYSGVLPYIIADVMRLALLFAFPTITLFLPNRVT